MKNIFTTFLSLLLLSLSLVAKSSDYGKSRIKKMSWQGIDVTWLQDDRFPTYSIQIYFADGALGDGKSPGLTQTTFNLLSSGTSQFDQKKIADDFEYLGASFGASVSHEQTTYSISGMLKDLNPTMTKICHLFNDATYPPKELNNYKKRRKSHLENLVNSHDSLSNRAFREISLSGTPYQNPVNGKLKNLNHITSKKLTKALSRFNLKVKKRIYISGPEEALSIKGTILEKCGWNPNASFVRKTQLPQKNSPSSGPKIHLVTVPRANQSKVLIGRYLHKSELTEQNEMHSLMATILASDYASLLMKELRVKRGWVYYAHSYSGRQRDYGRAMISTATDNKNLIPLLKEIRNSLQILVDRKFPSPKQFEIFQNSLAQKHPFRFQHENYYLSQLSNLDHLGKNYSELYLFPQRIRSYSLQDVANLTKKIFSWKKQTIVILGPASLKKNLERIGKVTVTSYKKYL